MRTEIGPGGAWLSGGWRQRAGLARALYGRPACVVLDEPDASLDAEGNDALEAALTALKARRCTVIVMSHRSRILKLADRMLVLREGQQVAFGPRDDVLAAMHKAAAAQTTANIVRMAVAPPGPARWWSNMSRTEALDGIGMPADRVAMASAGARPWLIKALMASLAVNLLILTPTLYMLQLYERVLYSMNSLTLLAVSVMAALLLAIMGYADGLRGIWLAGAASSFQQRLQGPLFEAGWRAGVGTIGGDGIGWQREPRRVAQFHRRPRVLRLAGSPLDADLYRRDLVAASGTRRGRPVLRGSAGTPGVAGICPQPDLFQSGAVGCCGRSCLHVPGSFHEADTIDALGMAPALRSRWLLRHVAALEVTQQSGSLTNRLAAVSKTLRTCSSRPRWASGRGWPCRARSRRGR